MGSPYLLSSQILSPSSLLKLLRPIHVLGHASCLAISYRIWRQAKWRSCPQMQKWSSQYPVLQAGYMLDGEFYKWLVWRLTITWSLRGFEELRCDNTKMSLAGRITFKRMILAYLETQKPARVKTFVTTFLVWPAVLEPTIASPMAYPVGHANSWNC